MMDNFNMEQTKQRRKRRQSTCLVVSLSSSLLQQQQQQVVVLPVVPSRIIIMIIITTVLFAFGSNISPVCGFLLQPKNIVGSSSTTTTTYNTFLISTTRRRRMDTDDVVITTTKSSSSSSSSLRFARTDVPHPDASDETYGIPYSSSLPPLYGDGQSNNNKKRKLKVLPNGGRVTLVGSGPGDPNLLTVSAYKLLTEAQPNYDIIIVDRLVSNEILNIIPPGVTIKIARKMPGCAELAQEEIYWWSYQGLNAGKHIIRLKIGDPFVFGRGGEEILQYRLFGIEPIVIPGVSAAFSAPLLGNIPVTHRGVANQVVMCTGYGRDGTSPDLIQYHKEQTVVFLMAVGRLQELCTKLCTLAKYPSNTPVAIVEKAGCPNQRTVVGDLTSIPSIAQKYNIQAPSTIIVGNVVNVLLYHDDDDDDDDDNTTGEVINGIIQNATTITTTTMSSSSSSFLL